jgi:hypothetical protein
VDIVGVALMVALLVCPLMMLLMHRGMTHRQHVDGHGESLSDSRWQRDEIEAAIRAREEAEQSPAEEEQTSDRPSVR